ncbi:DMT family transporter [Ruegeria sp. 2205SS24-7]|uniref:DMT family transporter n=1 Tax=Ruegeria discodermiae TaxID=3064389 RepID=UPI00274223C5|nr:DMT family transporter [Ruegeria sp. 2205SS24-7]MDP5219216.1 DMT family transporter [Ruegeria sp. 2205SS24-7]
MRLILLICLTMVAFAANSILNRLAVGSDAADPGSFAVVRVLAGAVFLCLLVLARGGRVPLTGSGRVVGALSLTIYMVGFSMAYLTLDAGLGALILFGVVQIAMFAFGALRGARPSPKQILGAAIAFAGLAYVLWPSGGAQVDAGGAALMALAGLGWAAYTLAGRSAPDALKATAANFVVALPLTAAAIWVVGPALNMTLTGLALACLSGAVTSGMGYALWYRLVPQLSPAVAATVQLSVPVIALVAGVLLLGEVGSLSLVLGTALVLGGIALAVLPGARR